MMERKWVCTCMFYARVGPCVIGEREGSSRKRDGHPGGRGIDGRGRHGGDAFRKEEGCFHK